MFSPLYQSIMPSLVIAFIAFTLLPCLFLSHATPIPPRRQHTSVFDLPSTALNKIFHSSSLSLEDRAKLGQSHPFFNSPFIPDRAPYNHSIRISKGIAYLASTISADCGFVNPDIYWRLMRPSSVEFERDRHILKFRYVEKAGWQSALAMRDSQDHSMSRLKCYSKIFHTWNIGWNHIRRLEISDLVDQEMQIKLAAMFIASSYNPQNHQSHFMPYLTTNLHQIQIFANSFARLLSKKFNKISDVVIKLPRVIDLDPIAVTILLYKTFGIESDPDTVNSQLLEAQQFTRRFISTVYAEVVKNVGLYSSKISQVNTLRNFELDLTSWFLPLDLPLSTPMLETEDTASEWPKKLNSLNGFTDGSALDQAVAVVLKNVTSLESFSLRVFDDSPDDGYADAMRYALSWNRTIAALANAGPKLKRFDFVWVHNDDDFNEQILRSAEGNSPRMNSDAFFFFSRLFNAIKQNKNLDEVSINTSIHDHYNILAATIGRLPCLSHIERVHCLVDVVTWNQILATHDCLASRTAPLRTFGFVYEMYDDNDKPATLPDAGVSMLWKPLHDLDVKTGYTMESLQIMIGVDDMQNSYDVEQVENYLIPLISNGKRLSDLTIYFDTFQTTLQSNYWFNRIANAVEQNENIQMLKLSQYYANEFSIRRFANLILNSPSLHTVDIGIFRFETPLLDISLEYDANLLHANTEAIELFSRILVDGKTKMDLKRTRLKNLKVNRLEFQETVEDFSVLADYYPGNPRDYNDLKRFAYLLFPAFPDLKLDGLSSQEIIWLVVIQNGIGDKHQNDAWFQFDI